MAINWKTEKYRNERTQVSLALLFHFTGVRAISHNNNEFYRKQTQKGSDPRSGLDCQLIQYLLI